MTQIVFVIAVHNEAIHLEKTLQQLRRALSSYPIAAVILCENGSTDSSLKVCHDIKKNWAPFPVKVLSIPEGDLGLALHAGLLLSSKQFKGDETWALLTAADLPFSFTDLDAFLKLRAQKDFDMAIGSKAHAESVLPDRGKRAVFSSVFFILRKIILGLDIKDTQGTVFVRTSCLPQLLPKVLGRGFFFTTDLIWQSHRNGLRLFEVPVTLNPEIRQSKVKVLRTGAKMLAGLIRLRLG